MEQLYYTGVHAKKNVSLEFWCWAINEIPWILLGLILILPNDIAYSVFEVKEMHTLRFNATGFVTYEYHISKTKTIYNGYAHFIW